MSLTNIDCNIAQCEIDDCVFPVLHEKAKTTTHNHNKLLLTLATITALYILLFFGKAGSIKISTIELKYTPLLLSILSAAFNYTLMAWTYVAIENFFIMSLINNVVFKKKISFIHQICLPSSVYHSEFLLQDAFSEFKKVNNIWIALGFSWTPNWA